MSRKFNKVGASLKLSGISSKCAGVVIRSSTSFWYICHKKFEDVFEAELELYRRLVPIKDEYPARTL